MCPEEHRFSAVQPPREGEALFLITLQLLEEAGNDHQRCTLLAFSLQWMAAAPQALASWL